MRTRSGRVLILLACAAPALAAPARAQAPTCSYRGAPSALSERPSPLDSVLVRLGDAQAKLCYGRPAAGPEAQVGGTLPFGSPWQLGANEPTTLHLPFPASVGGVDVAAGSYTLYAIPESSQWTIVVNGNPNRWGVPIGAEVRAADLGSFRATPTRLPQHVDRLTFRFEPSGPDAGALVFEWERTRLNIPISRR